MVVVSEADARASSPVGSTDAVETAASARATRHVDRLPLAALLVTLLPHVIAAVRAIRAGWVPVGDSALLSIRAHDVLGRGELPFLGMWSARSWDIDYHVHHPGPLFFDLLAIPVRLAPGTSGYVVGAMLVNSAAVVGIFVLARRRGGPLLAVGAMAVAGALAWSMGSAVLVEPWTVNTMLLPFLCYCLLAWSVADGDLWCVPWAAFVGSLLIQSNLAFSVLVPGLALFAAVALVLDGRRQPGLPETDRAVPPVRWRRPAALTALVITLAWARPFYEQFFGSGEGNMTLLARSSSEPMWFVSAEQAVRTVAKITALPPWWGRPSYSDALPHSAFGNPLPPLVLAVVALGMLAGLLTWGLRDSWSRGDHTTTRLAAAGLTVLVLTLVTAKSTPSSAVGALDYQFRWLWPAGAFIAFALARALAQQAVQAARRRPLHLRPSQLHRRAAVGLGTLTLAFAVLNIPQNQHGAAMPAGTLPVARQITSDITAADLEGPLLVECIEGVADPYCEAVLAELQRHDVAFVIDEADDVALRQLGQERRWDGTNARATLLVITGDLPRSSPPSGFREISAHDGLSRAERDELSALEEALQGQLASGDLQLNDRGVRVAARDDLPSVDPDSPTPEIDPELAVEAREALLGPHRRDLVAMTEEDLLDADDTQTRQLERYAELQSAWDEQTVAVFLGPVPEPRSRP